MPTSPLLPGLVEERARLSGNIIDLYERLERLRAMLVHVDATIRLIEPSYRPETIVPKRAGGPADLFTRRELSRLCLDVVREAEEPPTSKEVAKAILRRTGMAMEDKALQAVVERAVETALQRREGRQVRRVLTGPLRVGWAMLKAGDEP